jgi:ABC-type multidrug transport system fused ATPase/permease subunit
VWTPIHSYWQEVLRGGNIIRAFHNEDMFIKREYEMMDKTTIHFIAHHSCWVWFVMRTRIICLLVAAIGMAACLTMKGSVSSVTLSLVITYTMDLDWVCHLFGCFNWLERNLINCERLFKLQNVLQERSKGTVKVKDDWVTDGKITFNKVDLRYRKDTEIALNQLSFDIEAGQKVGVCGRTGAGKSTVSMALSRIVEIESGSIVIDGVNI